MSTLDMITGAIKRFLRIDKRSNKEIVIDERFSFRSNVAKNRIWHRGDAYELEQFYEKLEHKYLNFWGSKCSPGMEIRKIHLGLSNLIVSMLTNIVTADLNKISFKDEKQSELWKEIAKDNDFEELISQAITEALAIGECYFKIGFSEAVSKYPIIELVPADNVEHDTIRGRIITNKFYTYYDVLGKTYVLEETYGKGFIKYKLFDQSNGKEVKLSILEQTKYLSDITFDVSVNLSVGFKIFNSTKFPGRGASVFDTKEDALDSLDEIYSQWMESIRAARTKTYIPESLIPRNSEGGYLMKPNPFDNKFIKIESDSSENGSNKVLTETPAIQTNDMLAAYVTALDACLQGLISQSTLGIDVKKLDNAESQREKEKATLYTRGMIVTKLETLIKNLVQVCFDSYNLQYELPLEEANADVQFGEYANPSFEALVETMSNINTPISIEAKVEELWGDTRTTEWKQEEIARIKSERGVFVSEMI